MAFPHYFPFLCPVMAIGARCAVVHLGLLTAAQLCVTEGKEMLLMQACVLQSIHTIVLSDCKALNPSWPLVCAVNVFIAD